MSKSYGDHTPVSHVLICPLDWKFAKFKEFYLVLLFRIEQEVPVRLPFPKLQLL